MEDWKKSYVIVKSYTAPLYHKKISEITEEDIQKLFDEITAKKYYVTANNTLMNLSPIFNKSIDWELLDKILYVE
ncbi:hypothetical protein [Orientia tsutsugamushi]|uniref:hypothetical protein n=1 Tax=Orientia tsutsugamushi TaxID=784 RepID=UPI001E35DE6A|nr:hypothetical protein [Orientia tsutsugamushi]